MSEKVKRLRPRYLDTITESIQVILDAPLDLTWEARSCLNEVLGKVAPPETWGFVMLNPEQQRLVLRAINQGEKPNVTLRVWIAAISHIRYDTGEIMARRKRLAEDADTTPEETSRALTQLTEIGHGDWGAPQTQARPLRHQSACRLARVAAKTRAQREKRPHLSCQPVRVAGAEALALRYA